MYIAALDHPNDPRNMGDAKELSMSEKGEGIPLPVAETARPRRQRIRKLLKFLFVFSLVYVGILRWAQILKPQVEEETERWLANPFAAPWERGHGRPGRGKGHKVLNGKLAEDLFLYVYCRIC